MQMLQLASPITAKRRLSEGRIANDTSQPDGRPRSSRKSRPRQFVSTGTARRGLRLFVVA
jgi:hypothetical protein